MRRGLEVIIVIPFDFDDEDAPARNPAEDAATRPGSGGRSRRWAFDADEPAGLTDTYDIVEEAEAYAAFDATDWDDDDNDDDDDDVSDAWPASADAPVAAGAGITSQVRQYLVGLSKDELVALVEQMAAQDGAVRQALVDQVANARGPTADLLRGARTTIDSISFDALYEGNAPDNGEILRLRDRFNALIARGHADDVRMLCQRLLRHANHAVQAMEETDEALLSAIQHALGVLPEALARSSTPTVEQMLWLHELELSEEYDLLPDMADFWLDDWPAEVWNELAARIEQQIAAMAPQLSSSDAAYGLRRARDAWAGLLAVALQNAGRDDEVQALYEREAETTGNYLRLVQYLLGQGDLERAEHWIRQGVAATPAQVYGPEFQLRQALRTVRERQGDAAGIAALDAYEFFRQPSLTSFQALLKSAAAVERHEPVRLHALRFLETLILPWKRATGEEAAAASAGDDDDGALAESEVTGVDLSPWPLPPTELPDPALPLYEQPPLARVLLDVALAESRLDDVLAWYDRLRARRSDRAFYGYSAPSAAVARAVERSHPDRAIAIWEELAASAIGRTNTEAYREAARYLDIAGRIEERRGNLAAWRQRILDLQARERRKWRLREALDDLLRRFPPA